RRARRAGVRGASFLSRPHLRRGQEDRLARRAPGALVHPQIRPDRLSTPRDDRSADACAASAPDASTLPVKLASRWAARLDLAVPSALAAIGAIQFALCEAGTAFHGGDTAYLELARSIVEGRPYGFDFRAETMLPPGFPALLAALQLVLGDSHLRLV